jgi:NTE family protein
MGDYEKAVSLWKNISYSSIMNVDDAQMDKLINRRFKELSIQTVRMESKKILVKGGIDVTPLRQLLEELVDEQKIRESDIDFIMGTFSVTNMKEMDISAKEAEDGYLKDYLMASSNFPLFKNEKLHGKTYLDGGVTNNVPIDMLIKRGYKNIIVVRIFGPGVEKRIKIPEDVTVISIAPKMHLCNVLEFDKKKAVRNINLGYMDGLRMLRALAGYEYYIDSDKGDKECLDSMTSLKEEQMKALLMVSKIDTTGSVLRKYLEEIYPKLAVSMKLEKNWSYIDLFYTILEYCAKKVRLPRFKVYTDQEFYHALYDRMIKQYENEDIPDSIMELGFVILYNNLA